MRQALKIGDKVRVYQQHWLRGGQVGKIIKWEDRGDHCWCVKFLNKIVGRGLDGDKIWLTEQDVKKEE